MIAFWLELLFRLAVIVIAVAMLPSAIEAVKVYWPYFLGLGAVIGAIAWLMWKCP